jgi:hypothetical protein
MELQGQTLIQAGQEQTLTIPAEVRCIAAGAFGENHTLEQLTIAANYTQFCAQHELEHCTMLKKVEIWGEVEDADGKRLTRPAALRDYLGLPEETQLVWECPTVWCLEDRCQFCGGALKGSVMRVCTFCGRIN